MQVSDRCIMFYINSLQHGGAERVMANLCNEFAENGYRVILLTTKKCDNEYKINSKIKRIYVEKEGERTSFFSRNISGVVRIRRILRELNPVFVLSFMPEANVRNVIATRGLGTKSYISVRTLPEREYPNYAVRLVFHFLLSFSDGCVFQTDMAMAQYPFFLRKKSCVILNPVSEEFYESNTLRKEDPVKIIAVGRLTAEKNYPVMLKAFELVHKEFDKVRFDIWGEGYLRKELLVQIQALGLDGIVELKGITEDMPKVYKGACIYVMTSDFEGMPNALMEAMASGCPVVATDCPCGGPAKLIEDGVNGFLVPVGRVDMIADRIKCLIENEELRNSFIRNSVQAAQQYRAEKIYEKWEEFLLRVE